MKSLILYAFILIILLSENKIISVSVDISLPRKEPKELEDLCLRRPYHKTAEPW